MTMLPTRLTVSMGSATPSEAMKPLKIWVIPLFVLVAIACFVYAASESSFALRFLAVVVGLVSLLATAAAVTGLMWLKPQKVSAVGREGRLVLTPPAVLQVTLSVATALALLAVAYLWLDPTQWTSQPYFARGAVIAAPLAGTIMLVETCWSLRRASGLTLDTHGLSGVRGGPAVHVNWSQLTDVQIRQVKKRRFLVLVSVDGVKNIPEGAISGDLRAAATIVAYYHRNPAERSHLNDGLDAVRHVDGEVRAGRFALS